MAPNGEVALKVAPKAPPDLILMDVVMPGIDGYETCRRLKQIPETKAIPIIFVTGKGDTNDILKGFEAGGVDFVTKPVQHEEVLARVRVQLQVQFLLKRLHQVNDQLNSALSSAEVANKQMEQQNVFLMASNRKLEDLNATKEQLLKNLSVLDHTHLNSLKAIHQELSKNSAKEVKEITKRATQEIDAIDAILHPMTTLYQSEQAVNSKRVLLAETNKKQQTIAKMALRGTGVELTIVSTIEEGKKCLEESSYDIICTNSELIELATFACSLSSEIQSVFITSDDASNYLSILRSHPFLSNIVSRNDDDRNFTLKNILTTVSKLLTQDFFGLEKYLNWGVEVQSHPIVGSAEREAIIDTMVTDFKNLGIRPTIQNKASLVAEELLMNAIYDAPHDAEGAPLYNHLSRTTEVALSPAEQGTFRYACDGILLAVSAEDPFGALDRETILAYLESCYQGIAGSLNENKGGAGWGLFQIMETSDLVVMDVKKGLRTEVIAIFNLDAAPQSKRTTSFHYFTDENKNH